MSVSLLRRFHSKVKRVTLKSACTKDCHVVDVFSVEVQGGTESKIREKNIQAFPRFSGPWVFDNKIKP